MTRIQTETSFQSCQSDELSSVISMSSTLGVDFDSSTKPKLRPVVKQDIFIGTTRFAPDPSISNILVTGGLGFIASWLIRHLVTQYPKYTVVCIDNLGYCSSTNNMKSIKDQPNFHFVKADVTDFSALEQVVNKFNIDTIIHMAAESHVDNSFGNPGQFTKTNVIGTQNLLEVAKNKTEKALKNSVGSSIKPIYRFIHMSTDEVYGEVTGDGADLLESAILAPTNPYAASKAAGDMFVGAYLKSFNVPAIIVRCNNIYGPMQFPEKIIPKFIRHLQKNEPCTLHGNGENTRRYLFVVDAVNALDTILHRGKIGSIYNAGSDIELSNIQVTKKLLDLFGFDSSVPEVFRSHTLFTSDRPFNDARYAVDSTRLKKLGWVPTTDFDTGIKMTLEWYLNHTDNWWKNDSLNST